MPSAGTWTASRPQEAAAAVHWAFVFLGTPPHHAEAENNGVLVQAAQLLKFNKIQAKKAEAGGSAGNPFSSPAVSGSADDWGGCWPVRRQLQGKRGQVGAEGSQVGSLCTLAFRHPLSCAAQQTKGCFSRFRRKEGPSDPLPVQAHP